MDKEKTAPRRRDSSLYRSVAEQQQQLEGDSGNASANDEQRNRYKFVLASTDPEVVSVDHQAVIEELTASLDKIEATRAQLEQDLGDNNKANKLQIAQIKGRLADLNRRRVEIEALLGSRARESDNSAEND